MFGLGTIDINVEWNEDDIDATLARLYYNDSDLSASTDGIEVREYHNQVERNGFILEYLKAKERKYYAEI